MKTKQSLDVQTIGTVPTVTSSNIPQNSGRWNIWPHGTLQGCRPPKLIKQGRDVAMYPWSLLGPESVVEGAQKGRLEDRMDSSVAHCAIEDSGQRIGLFSWASHGPEKFWVVQTSRRRSGSTVRSPVGLILYFTSTDKTKIDIDWNSTIDLEEWRRVGRGEAGGWVSNLNTKNEGFAFGKW